MLPIFFPQNQSQRWLNFSLHLVSFSCCYSFILCVSVFTSTLLPFYDFIISSRKIQFFFSPLFLVFCLLFLELRNEIWIVGFHGFDQNMLLKLFSDNGQNEEEAENELVGVGNAFGSCNLSRSKVPWRSTFLQNCCSQDNICSSWKCLC